jgi:hypothetical protein
VVQAAACGALCNLVLEFSPMKKSVIEAGAIKRFVDYSRSSNSDLQLNGTWAINNLLYRASLEAKKAVMKELSFDSLHELLQDSNIAVQEQALEILRNLVYGKQQDTEWVYETMGKDVLLDILESKLQVTSSMGLDDEADAAKISVIIYLNCVSVY